MAMAAAPYLHPKLSAVDAKLTAAVPAQSPEKFRVEFVLPNRNCAHEDHEK
jgi:hypothetical protein